jgi:hypothetical protein
MANIKVAVINASTVVADADVQAAVPALQEQVSRDFAAAWGIDAELSFVPSTAQPPAGLWWLSILDNSDQAGALGYHDVTADGLPLGKVFAATDQQYGNNWTVTASHELLELLADPEINLTVFVQPDNSSGRLYAYEVCDACEADTLGYSIDGTVVSDFVFPAWFESSRQPNSTQFDFANQITAPLQLLPGGYIGIFDITTGQGWTQLTPPGQPRRYSMRAQVGSRRERRRTLRSHWIRSQLTRKGR